MSAALRILVPTDFNASFQGTLAHACTLADPLGAELHLLHVLPAHDLPGSHGGGHDERARMARQQLERLAQRAALNRVKVEFATRTGRPAAEIVRYAREQGIGLIVMSTHGRTGLAHLVMGSVAEQVLRDGTCPVLAMRPSSFPGQARPQGLAEMARRLAAELGTVVEGDRQATWESMSRLLEREFQLEATEAARLLGFLEAAGVVVWHEGRAAYASHEATRGYWAIDPAALGPEAAPAPISAPTAAPVDDESTPTLDLVRRALASRATDVHIDPQPDDRYEVRFRIDGKLEPYCLLDRGVAAPLIQQIKVMAGFDIAEPFLPKEGRLELPPSMAELEVRITTAPVQGGTAAALRLLSRDRALMPLEGLGLSEAAHQQVELMLRSGAGLVLVTGPTGSGKTTSIYSILNRLAGKGRNIVSIEDPVEFHLPFIRQLGVDLRHGVTMTSGLRTVLRMDPDIVFVSEVRDVEAAEIAMRAASSGRFVFTTLHTRDIASTVTAIRDLHIDNRSLAGNLTGILSQRLLRRVCPQCGVRAPVAAAEAEVFAAEGLNAPAELVHAPGCEHCRGTGYRDRIGVFEATSLAGAVGEAILAGASEVELRQTLRSAGTVSLMADALQKAAQGITTLEEAQAMKWV